ncbi:MAG: DUF1080 domain-containing protein [Phycisphaeraceae bacterium]|nr:DUF1080 domain-containing protein [Phycisphaeraceae bacterium]
MTSIQNTAQRIRGAACILAATLAFACLPALGAGEAHPAAHAAQHAASLSPAEVAGGWRLLFDGQSTQGWRGYRQQAFPAKGWEVKDGALCVLKGGGGGDIITEAQFGDFELSLEFMCTPKANSGIIYRVQETAGATWQTGPEFQVLDDHGHGLTGRENHSAGGLYDLAQPAETKALKPAGEWNHARVRIHDGVVQHFLNGVKVVECEIKGDGWAQRIAGSKFKEFAGFGVSPRGHIALQEHGDEVWYRNIKVRDLDAPLPNEVALFNGKDLKGWTAHLRDDGRMESVWSVHEGGVLVCAGQPIGYIRTEKEYTSYVLKLEWRFSPVTKQAGNSGVLLRVQRPDTVWPRSIEAQLMSGSAGDFWNIGEYPMQTEEGRRNGRNTKHTHKAERAIGEWNAYEIIVDGPVVTLRVNGEEVNSAWDCAVMPGTIALQSEGAEIHFRRVRLSPLE